MQLVGLPMRFIALYLKNVCLIGILGCLERSCSLPSWRVLRHSWIKPWATWCDPTWSKRLGWRHPQVPSKLNYAVMPSEEGGWWLFHAFRQNCMCFCVRNVFLDRRQELNWIHRWFYILSRKCCWKYHIKPPSISLIAFYDFKHEWKYYKMWS